jgi:hypothetical protein
MRDERGHHAPRFRGRLGRRQPKPLALETLVPPLQLAIALRIIRTGADVRDARQADELLKIPGDRAPTRSVGRGAIVRNDPRSHVGDDFILLGQLELFLGDGGFEVFEVDPKNWAR